MQKAAGLAPFARLSFALKALSPFRLAHAFQREALLVAALGAAAFYLTALASFSPLDPSAVSVALPEAAALNLAGAVGANVSALALFVFGATAWLLPLPLVATATLVVRRDAEATARSRVLGWIMAFTCLTAFVALRFPVITWHGFDFPGGGAVGSSLAGHLLQELGRVGGFIIIATAALCAVLLILRQSLLEPVLTLARGDGSRPPPAERGARPPLWWDRFLHPAPRQADEGNSPAPPAATNAEGDDDEPASDDEPDIGMLPVDLSGPREPRVASAARFAVPAAFAGAAASPASPPRPLAAATELHGAGPAPPRKEPTRPAAPAYSPPPLSVFNTADGTAPSSINPKDLEATAALLVRTFEDFGVQGKIIGYQPGPVVTVFEFQPDAGVKQSKIVGLIDDVALALKVDSIFIHPVRGKRALGVQVPNTKREAVHLGDILANASFRDAPSPLTFGMGKTISGVPMSADLTAMPHLLVAGATGSGKSVAINAMLCSIIMKASPDDVRMILVDPKMLELSVYEGIPHLLMPVITEPNKASLALKWATTEMERRYKLMQLACVRNIAGFNEFWSRASDVRRQQLCEAVGDETLTKLPYILLVIDELADLMMTAPKDVESSIQRLAQKARASGIHMVLATQRPSVDIITGVIKANLPCRIAFQVVSKHDSRTILDLIGAEKLLGKGDMLLQRPGIGRLERLQGALITDDEVINLVAKVKESSTVHYDEAIIAWIDDEYTKMKDGDAGGDDAQVKMDDDPKWDEALALARSQGAVSASFLQRHLKIGYNRAARIVEFMESKGLVDRADGARPRKWLGQA